MSTYYEPDGWQLPAYVPGVRYGEGILAEEIGQLLQRPGFQPFRPFADDLAAFAACIAAPRFARLDDHQRDAKKAIKAAYEIREILQENGREFHDIPPPDQLAAEISIFGKTVKIESYLIQIKILLAVSEEVRRYLESDYFSRLVPGKKYLRKTQPMSARRLAFAAAGLKSYLIGQGATCQATIHFLIGLIFEMLELPDFSQPEGEERLKKKVKNLIASL